MKTIFDSYNEIPKFNTIKSKGFAFLNLPLDISKVGTINLGYEYLFRYADEVEKKTIEYFFNIHLHPTMGYINNYIQEHIEGVNYKLKSFDNRKYVVIECPVSSNNITFLSPIITEALGLFNPHLYVLFVVSYEFNNGKFVPTMSKDPFINQRILNSAEPIFFQNDPIYIVLNKNKIKELKRIINQLVLFSNMNKNEYDFNFFYYSISVYDNLIQIPISSPYRLIIIFSIIEGLLINDSIKEKSQVLRKMVKSLSKRRKKLKNLPQKIGFKEKFSTESFLETAYKFRNSLAHGSQPNWDVQLKIFNNHYHLIFPFVDTILSEILMDFYNDPIAFILWRKSFIN